ncbi:hypothetical protein BASA83_007909 [Batrachochytrium salamandrivorans]|nr:hypothetical protein BASA83_007909 [Batrachochytrium salamandrivorans]
MDAELADRLNIPLVKIPVPIKLRLADGDSSSMITHRTYPSSCTLVDMLKQLVSMSSLCHGIILGYLAGETQSPSQLGVQDGGFWIQLLLEIVVLGRLDQGLGKPPNPDIDLKLFKDKYGSIWESKASTSSFQQHFEIGLIRRNDSSRSLSFLEASPIRDSYPPEINRNFQVYFPSLS